MLKYISKSYVHPLLLLHAFLIEFYEDFIFSLTNGLFSEANLSGIC